MNKPTPKNPAAAASTLIEAIRAIAQANQQLAILAGEQRQAIARMAADRVQAVTEQQRQVGRELAQAEEDRRAQAAALAAALALPKSASIQDLAKALGRFDAQLAQDLTNAAKAARTAILACQGQQRVVHAAANGIVAHIDGLARQVMAKLNSAGIYAATGALNTAQTTRGVDLVS